jgi:hypothetical protein
MTDFFRPGAVGTNEHDTGGEFSKVRLNRPLHDLFGKAQPPVPLGSGVLDDQIARMHQRYLAAGSQSIEDDVKAIITSYERSIDQLLEADDRVPSIAAAFDMSKKNNEEVISRKTPKNGDEKQPDTSAQRAIEVLNNLNKLGLSNRWRLQLVGMPQQYKAQAVPMDNLAPLILMDALSKSYEVFYPPYKASTEINLWTPY